MSYASEKKRANPVTMGAAIALNGSIIVAVALSPMVAEYVAPPPTTTVTNVPVQPLPPPPDNMDPVDTLVTPPVVTPKPLVDTSQKPPVIDTTSTEGPPIFTTDAGGGDDAVGIVDAVKPPVPVFKAALRDPRFARNFQPDYPPGLLKSETEGKATVKVLIGTDGRVRQVVILSASHPDFGKATERQALREWRFKPATRDGVAVEDWQTLTVRFDIT